MKKDERVLILRIRDLAAARVRYGYRRITVLLKRAAQRRISLPAASAAQERWSMDFMSDRLTQRAPLPHSHRFRSV